MNKKKVLRNASWIIGLQITKVFINLCISMLTARFLGPSNYGLINYAASIVAFVVPIMYLGLNGTLVQELVSNPDEEGKILGTSLLMSGCSSVLCILGIAAFTCVVNAGEKETIIVCMLYSLLLLFQSVELLTYWFQAHLISQYSVSATLGSYILVSLYRVFLLATGKNIYWFAFSYVLDYVIISIFLLFIYWKKGKQKLEFSMEMGKRLFSRSKYYIISDMMVTIFAQTDRIMLKVMINDAATGFYSAAMTCAIMTNFVFGAILDSARPMILDNKKHDQVKFEENVVSLYSIIIYMSLAQSFVITILAKYIIQIMYGSAYMQSVEILRIAVWYSTFAYIGSVRNIWILAEEKQQYLWRINLYGAILNIVLNGVLITFLGVNGAAIASLITQIFTNFIVGYLIKDIRGNNRLLIISLNPRILYCTVKKLILR